MADGASIVTQSPSNRIRNRILLHNSSVTNARPPACCLACKVDNTLRRKDLRRRGLRYLEISLTTKLDARYSRRPVDGRLFAGAHRAAPRQGMSHPSLGLDRFAQSLCGRSALLLARKPRYLGRFVAQGLGWLSNIYLSSTHSSQMKSSYSTTPAHERRSVMSYLEYFKLRGQPFSEHVAREALWNDTRMEEGLSRLTHLVHR